MLPQHGNINIAGAGTASQVILGDLTLTDLPVGTVNGTGTANFVSKWLRLRHNARQYYI